jgi:hypothetical protein
VTHDKITADDLQRHGEATLPPSNSASVATSCATTAVRNGRPALLGLPLLNHAGKVTIDTDNRR